MSWGEYLRVDTRARLAVAARQQNNPGIEDLAQDGRQRQAAMVALENWKRQQQALVRSSGSSIQATRRASTTAATLARP